MASQPKFTHEPTRAEVVTWRQLAAQAGRVATGKDSDAKAWRDLRGMAAAARYLKVFGQDGPANVCTLLIEEIFRLADSAAPDKPLDELSRCAHEVLRLCDVYDEIRKAFRQ